MSSQVGTPDWMVQAACAGVDPDLFHPDDPEAPDRRARVLCVNCPVLADCIEHALLHEAGERSVGFWAGMTPRERRVEVRRRRRIERQAMAS